MKREQKIGIPKLNARVISDPDFEQQIALLAGQPRTIRGQHACWVLTQIREARKSEKEDH